MPLELPNLDDRTYEDLVQEALNLIPAHAPDWTNFNPSDPGITLIELFAYLSEILIYRLDRVTDNNVCSFLKLLNGPEWEPPRTGAWFAEDLREGLRETIQKLRQQERAVTCKDFEELALAADDRIARVLCLPRRDLRIDFESIRNGHIGIIILPKKEHQNSIGDIIEKIKKDLEKRRLLTTRFHAVEARYLEVKVQVRLVPLTDVTETEIEPKAKAAIERFLDPFEGGEARKGWQFGRDIFVSEIYQLLDRLSGVDYVTFVNLQPCESNLSYRIIEKQGALTGIKLKPHELVYARVEVKVETASNL